MIQISVPCSVLPDGGCKPRPTVSLPPRWVFLSFCLIIQNMPHHNMLTSDLLILIKEIECQPELFINSSVKTSKYSLIIFWGQNF